MQASLASFDKTTDATPMTLDELDALDLPALLEFSADLDLTDPVAATARLEEAFPFQGERIQALGEALCAAKEAGGSCGVSVGPLQWRTRID